MWCIMDLVMLRGTVRWDFSRSVRFCNNSKKAVTYGGSGSDCEVIITGVFENEDGKQYPMTYKGKNGSFPAGEKVEIKDFELEVSAKICLPRVEKS